MAFIQRIKLRLILSVIGLLSVLAIGLPLLLAALSMVLLLNKTCQGDRYAVSVEEIAPSFERVEFAVGQLNREAYFYPAESRATVMIAPGYSSLANGEQDYVRMFLSYGLNVLVVGSRRCDGARQTLGYLEGADVQAAYEYLRTRSDVDPERVSVHGFSAAGAAALFGAAQTPSLRAVSAMGNYHDMTQSFAADAFWEYPIDWGIRFGFWAGTGQSTQRLKPIEVIDQIVPRPILLIYGSDEPSLEGGKAMAQRAGAFGELWIVPNAGHGGYWSYSVDEISKRLGGFHAQHLLGKGGE